MVAANNNQISMPAITLWQPWASLVAVGAKPYETRGRNAPARLIGQRVAIHAAARRPERDLPRYILAAITDALGAGWLFNIPLGAVVCTAILATSERTENVPYDLFGDYSPGRFAWRLDDVKPVRPHIPAKGMRLIGWRWTVPEGNING
jgi:hypothetical protein